MKKIWAHDFHEAYKKSLKGTKGVDAKACWLFAWLIDHKHIVPRKYKVVARCGVCLKHFDPKKWDGTVIKKTGEFVCPSCVKHPKPTHGSTLLKPPRRRR